MNEGFALALPDTLRIKIIAGRNLIGWRKRNAPLQVALMRYRNRTPRQHFKLIKDHRHTVHSIPLEKKNMGQNGAVAVR